MEQPPMLAPASFAQGVSLTADARGYSTHASLLNFQNVAANGAVVAFATGFISFLVMAVVKPCWLLETGGGGGYASKWAIIYGALVAVLLVGFQRFSGVKASPSAGVVNVHTVMAGCVLVVLLWFSLQNRNCKGRAGGGSGFYNAATGVVRDGVVRAAQVAQGAAANSDTVVAVQQAALAEGYVQGVTDALGHEGASAASGTDTRELAQRVRSIRERLSGK